MLSVAHVIAVPIELVVTELQYAAAEYCEKISISASKLVDTSGIAGDQ